MKSVKLVFSFGVIMAIATSSQVKGIDNPYLSQEKKNDILQKENNIIKKIKEANDTFNSMPSKYRIDHSLDQSNKIKAFEAQQKRLETIYHDTIPYTTSEIDSAYASIEKPAKNPYLTTQQVDYILGKQSVLKKYIDYCIETNRSADKSNDQFKEFNRILEGKERYTMAQIKAIYK